MSKSSNLNTSDKSQSVLGSGLFSGYDSRLGRLRISSKTYSSMSEKFPVRSSNRSNSKGTKPLSDENLVSNPTVICAENVMLSPVISGVSPFRATPLSHSKRFNINDQSNLQNSPGNLNQSRVSSMENSSPAKSLNSPNSFPRIYSCEEKCPSTFAGRMITVANQMDCDQFPWVASNGSIPMMHSNPHKHASPAQKFKSSSSDVNSSFRNRVRVRMSKPCQSSTSVLNSTVDNTSNLDESSTTKSVIQVLKEIARKRCFVNDDDEVLEGPPQTKRRTEHNLYLSRLEGEEEQQIPTAQTRINEEDDRMKRTREPDWDTPNVSKPKRPRKNYNFVNNEIISSLSSSIGLHAFKHYERKRLMRKSIAVQVQTLVPNEKNGESKEQVQSSSLLPLSPPKTRDTGVVTDPLPEPELRPRSPVKEKVVSDVNGILKSALTKFDIQPSTSGTKGSDSITPFNSSSPAMPIVDSKVSESPSAVLITPFSSSNLTVISPPTNTETTASSSFSLATSKSSIAVPISSPVVFNSSVSAPQITFGMPSSLSEKSLETTKSHEREGKEESLPNQSNQDKLGFKLENKSDFKSGSTLKFGTPQPDSDIKSSISQFQTNSSGPFNFKVSETSTANQASVTGSPTFTFGTPKSQESADKAKDLEEKKNIMGEPLNTSQPLVNTTVASVSTPLIALKTPVTSMLLTQKIESSPLTVTADNSSEQKNELLKHSSSGFWTQNKLTEQVKSSKEDKKEVKAPGIFTFGKPENKVIPASNNLPESKPFQFGSGGFSFGQSNKGSIGELSNNPVSQVVSTIPSSIVSQPIFSFSSNAVKKEEKLAGFTFKASTTTSSEQKSLFTFNASTTSQMTAPSGFNSTTTVSSTKAAFPNSLFGNNAQTTKALTSTKLTSSSTLSTNSSIPNATFGGIASKTAPTFGLESVTPAPPFGSTNAPTFGSTTAPTFGSTTAPTFGTSTAPTFGSTTAPTFGTSTAPTFVSSTDPKPIFGGGSNSPSFSMTTYAPIFGTNIAKNETNKPPTFGSSSNNPGNPAFGIGAPSTSSSVPTFGSVAANNNPPTFGNTSGGTTTQPGFGSTVTGGSNASTFGSSTTPNTNVPTFGNALASGTGSATFGSTTVSGAAPSLFGPSTAGTSTSGYGGNNNAPSFGSNPSFGSSGTATTFGASSSAFGINTLATPAFGSQPQPSFGGNQTGTFGSTSAFGQTSTTPAFGTQNTFGNPSSSTSGFGSSPSFSGSTNAFANPSVPGTTPTFGATSTSGFGSSTAAFGNQEASKPFTFNAPASQPAAQQTGSFNFSAPQSQQGSGGLFQFGAGSTSTATNQPFQFNASQSSTPVGGTGQQMFSIGSGSTAPRRMPGRRKK